MDLYYHSRVILLLLCLAFSFTQCQDIFGFAEDSRCNQPGYLLLHSIPVSCNSALSSLLGTNGLPLDISQTISGELGDLCQTYCITPMRQAGEDCQPLAQLYSAIQAACQINSRGQRCFATRLTLQSMWENCSNITSCTEECINSTEMALHTMDCCFKTLVTTSGYNYSFELNCTHQQMDVCDSGCDISLHYMILLFLVTVTTYTIS